jgi:hypothetical protein
MLPVHCRLILKAEAMYVVTAGVAMMLYRWRWREQVEWATAAAQVA